MRDLQLTTGACVAAIAACASASLADNGRIGYAGAMDSIAVDADLSDWPAGLREHAIEVPYFGNPAKNAEDLSAWFRVGYNGAAGELYVAVEVVDDTHEPSPDGVAWRASDAVAVYIDTDHSQRGSGPLGYAVSGDARGLLGPEGAWDPRVAAGTLDGVGVAVGRTGNRTVYEYRLRVPGGVEAGTTIGFDVLVRDRDSADGEAQPTSLYWGQWWGKHRLAGRCGDLLLVDPDAGLATLRGQTVWADGMETMPAGLPVARVTSVRDERLWVQVVGDEDGRFEVELPPGMYELSYPFPVLGPLLGPHQVVDHRRSRAGAVVAPGVGGEAETLVLRRRSRPDLYEDRGVLFDYHPGRAGDIDAFVRAWMEYFSIPGVSLALVRDGEIVYHKVHGVRNAYTGEPVEADTVFEAASVTKIVFAYAVLRLAERGVIDLDQPLHELLPFDEIAHDDRYRLITARHVLTHRTGFPNWRSENPGGAMSIAFTPGTDFMYSGEGIEYLKRVVSHVTGKPIEAVLLDEVQRPMGFEHNTFFSASEELQRVVAHGHSVRRAYDARPPRVAGMAHSMHTEAGALARFMVGLLEGRGLSAGTYEEAFTMVSRSAQEVSEHDVPWPRGFGLGFSLTETPYGLAFGHGGNNGDFHAMFEAYRDHGVGYVVFANNERGWALNEVLRRYLIAGRGVPSTLGG